MPYNVNKPADSDLVSSSASDIRDNWSGLLNGDAKHVQLNLAKQAAAPAGVTDEGILYAENKTIASVTNSDLFWQNASEDALRITSRNHLGSSTTPARLQYAKLNGKKPEFDDRNVILAWGRVPAAGGSLTDSRHVASVAAVEDTSLYKITLDADICADTNYIILATSMTKADGSSKPRVVGEVATYDGYAKSTTLFALRTMNADGNKEAVEFSFAVIGRAAS